MASGNASERLCCNGDASGYTQKRGTALPPSFLRGSDKSAVTVTSKAARSGNLDGARLDAEPALRGSKRLISYLYSRWRR